MILPKERDPRFITVRRGGTLSDPDHHLLAIWAADCAQHVLHHFEQARPGDDRPRKAIELARAWARGEIPMKEAHKTAFIADAAARDQAGAAKMAALAAGQAVAVAHVAAPEHERDEAGKRECHWQRAQLPDAIRDLVLDDQRLRNALCWNVFDC